MRLSVPFRGQEGKGHPRQEKNLYKVMTRRLERVWCVQGTGKEIRWLQRVMYVNGRVEGKWTGKGPQAKGFICCSEELGSDPVDKGSPQE